MNLIIVYHLPQGGSITLGSMVPILILALRRGPSTGVFAGAVFGLVQLFLGGYWFTLVQVILDYPVAFACLGLAGFFRKNPMVGVAVSVAARFVSHFVSGVVFFGEYAPPRAGPRGLQRHLQRQLHASGAGDQRGRGLPPHQEGRPRVQPVTPLFYA